MSNCMYVKLEGWKVHLDGTEGDKLIVHIESTEKDDVELESVEPDNVYAYHQRFTFRAKEKSPTSNLSIEQK